MIGKDHELAQPSVILIDLLKCIIHYQFWDRYLYPLFRSEGKEVMKQLWLQDPEFRQQGGLLKRTVMQDQKSHPDWSMPALYDAKSANVNQILGWYYDVLLWYMDNGQETPAGLAMKERIYAQAYSAGRMQSIVYPDAVSCLKAGHETGIRLVLFSDAVHSNVQRLMLKHTTAGDLTPLF